MLSARRVQCSGHNLELVEILLIAVGVSMDAFAVALSAGSNKNMHSFRSSFRLSFHFGFFQFMMPVIGWFIGSRIERYIVSFDHWIAFGLLSFIGVRMILEYSKESKESAENPSKGWSLVTLSVATSIDALAVGLSLAFLQINILYPSIIFGVITGAFSFTGVKLGIYFGKKFGRITELIGGLILIVVGLKILFSHTL